MNNINIENLINLYGNDVLRIANIYVKNPIIAEDIFQDVFIKVANNLNSFKGKSNEKTWLIRITINTCKDYLKSSWKNKIVPMDELPEASEPDNINEKLINEETSSNIVKEILKLPEKYKEVIILYYYQSFSTSEIASILAIPEASVRTRMKRAREILKEKLAIVIEM